MKTKGRKNTSGVALGLPDEIIARQDWTVPMETWMERVHPGAWVLDDSCDRFIALDPSHTGPGVGYVVYDRRHRSATTLVDQSQIH